MFAFNDIAPVVTPGIDQPVDAVGQVIAVALSFGLAAVAVVYCVTLWRREQITWQFFLLASGLIASLMEPLFDHLYGLWFFEEGQWTIYETFGSNQPLWLPPAYLAFYGGASVVVARLLAKRPSMRTAWIAYAAIVAMSIAAELIYISLLGQYNYQDHQPFVLLGYPLFLGFTNATSALIGGTVAFGVLPWLTRTVDRMFLLMIIPTSFAMGLFGAGIFYLSVRHGFDDPPMWLVHVSALTVPILIAQSYRTIAKIALMANSGHDAAVLPETSDQYIKEPTA